MWLFNRFSKLNLQKLELVRSSLFLNLPSAEIYWMYYFLLIYIFWSSLQSYLDKMNQLHTEGNVKNLAYDQASLCLKWVALFMLVPLYTCQEKIHKAEAFPLKCFLGQQYAGISGFQRQPELWFCKVQRYCCTLLLLGLNHKMKDLILVITGSEWCRGMLGLIWLVYWQAD